ncbi:MAG: transketolase [Dehalococcoidia bacterium]
MSQPTSPPTSRPEIAELQRRSKDVRLSILEMVDVAGSGHYGPAFSCVEVLVALYYNSLSVKPDSPDWPERDRFILSKGHACTTLYAILADLGFFDPDELSTFARLGSILGDHPDMKKIPGVDFSSGSLGHGLSVGAGMAEALRYRKINSRVVVLVGDGELNEGQNWEAIAYAAHRGLGQLLCIVDANDVSVDGNTSDVLNLEPMDAKWEAFGWDARRVDGHDYVQIRDALRWYDSRREGPIPSVIVADTIAGYGIPFIEGMAEWHVGFLAGVDRQRAVDAIEDLFNYGGDR